MMKVAGLLALLLAAMIASGCGLAHTGSCTWSTSGRCDPYPHHWTAREVARDVASLTFPAATDPRDHLYRIRCSFTSAGRRAVCTGRGRIGAHAGQRVRVVMWLRPNGSLDPICWPNPSALCDPLMVEDQRTNPMTDT
jgi:hypothetical protein